MGLRCSGGGATDAFVDILVNGTPVITNLSVQPGNNGLVDDVFNYDQQIEIVVPYVVDGTVTIRTNRNGLAGQRLLSLTSIRIPRQVRIVNQGLSGTTTVSYLANCLDGNTSGDGVAITGTDMFVFVQLGTNDRGWSTGRPRGSNDFEVKYNALLDNAAFTGKKVILMAANPAGNEDPTDFPFHMQEVRNIIYRVARLRQFDMIDNYSVFAGMHNLMYTTDQLHPNDYGHSIIARNMINSLESA
jgi:lysophospholipase L1-like esterase